MDISVEWLEHSDCKHVPHTHIYRVTRTQSISTHIYRVTRTQWLQACTTHTHLSSDSNTVYLHTHLSSHSNTVTASMHHTHTHLSSDSKTVTANMRHTSIEWLEHSLSPRISIEWLEHTSIILIQFNQECSHLAHLACCIGFEYLRVHAHNAFFIDAPAASACAPPWLGSLLLVPRIWMSVINGTSAYDKHTFLHS
jgi:hypothetical protein